MLAQKKYIIVAIALFFSVIAVNFFKPFGFFRESNAALVCINAEIWNQNATIKNAGIPVNSYYFNAYQNTNDQLYNTTITFGNAWIALPYYFFRIFHLTPSATSIRLFSIFWLLFTMYSIFLLAKILVKTYQLPAAIVPLVIILYLFTPATLWYNIQGYVHEVAVLPFYFLNFFFFIQYTKTPKLKWLWLLCFGLIVAIQFDWLPCVQAAVFCVYLFFERRKIKYRLSFFVPIISVVVGVGYIFYHYGSWAGFEEYFTYMKSKFAGRAVGAKGLQLSSYINHNFNIFIFYVLSLGVIIAIAVCSLIRKTKHPIFIVLMLLTALLHHAIFWGFTNEHDHAAIKAMFPLIFIAASFLVALERKKMMIAVSLIVALNITQYFFLHNYPLRKGIYSNENYCYTVGNIVKKFAYTTDDVVFVNTANKHYLQIEFYAKRFYIIANDLKEAQQKFATMNIGKQACFLQFEEDKFVSVQRFSK
jgi:hypothetical protein